VREGFFPLEVEFEKAFGVMSSRASTSKESARGCGLSSSGVPGDGFVRVGRRERVRGHNRRQCWVTGKIEPEQNVCDAFYRAAYGG
jgi:hypothetical protein